MSEIFSILLKPRVTLDKLLREQNMKKSWQVTWAIIFVNALFMLLYFLMSKERLLSDILNANQDLELGVSTSTASSVSTTLAWVFWGALTVYAVLDGVLSRFGYEWFVRMGLRMVGGPQYAAMEPGEKRAKGRLMQLVQPYTLSIVMVTSIITMLIILLTMPNVPLDPSTPPALGQLVVQMITSSFASLLSLGAMVYMIFQRVFAIQAVYGVSGARAFWGPFIPYAITMAVFILISIVLVVLFFVAVFSSLGSLQ